MLDVCTYFGKPIITDDVGKQRRISLLAQLKRCAECKILGMRSK
jgi:hypothetical protein